MNTDKATLAIISVSMDLGRVPGLLAFAIWLKVRDERVLEMARSYVSRLERPKFAPDWIRCLANASHVDAIDDAFDDLAETPEFAFLRRVK
jgi:hypothetical protein